VSCPPPALFFLLLRVPPPSGTLVCDPVSLLFRTSRDKTARVVHFSMGPIFPSHPFLRPPFRDPKTVISLECKGHLTVCSSILFNLCNHSSLSSFLFCPLPPPPPPDYYDRLSAVLCGSLTSMKASSCRESIKAFLEGHRLRVPLNQTFSFPA